MSCSSKSDGFVIVGVLLLLGLMAAVSTTYMRHSVARLDGSRVSRAARSANESAESAFQYAQQALLTGHALDEFNTESSLTLTEGETPVRVDLAKLADGHARVRVEALAYNGLGNTRLVEFLRTSVADRTQAENLPTLKESVANTLMNDASVAKLYYNGDSSVSDADLYGLVIVRTGTRLTLDNVVIHGALVSADALELNAWNFNPMSRPEVMINGNVRIEPADFLPGVAIALPDGEVSLWNSGAHVQIRGDMVAHTIEMPQGFAKGNVATVAPFVTHSSFENVRGDRKPYPWADAWDLGDVTVAEYVATLPKYTTVNALPHINNFSFVAEFGIN